MFESLSRVGTLRRGILGLAETFALSLALLALVMASSLATSGAAGLAGPAVPLAYLVAGVGSLCLASVIIRFTRRMASAGGLYTYTSRGLGRNAGFVGGWLYSWGFAAGVSFVLVIASVFLSTVLTVHTGIDLTWFQCFWILLALLTGLSLLDIRFSTRTQFVVAALGVAVILVLAFVILAKGGDSGVTLQPFNPSRAGSAHDFFQAMVFAFTGFIGFEAAAALGEESAEPRKMIPKAILSAVLVALVFYVFLTWAMSVGFGVANSGKWASDPAALDTLATRYVGSGFATLVDIAVVVDAFVAALAGVALVSRTAFAMGREGGLPRMFAWTHPRLNTPWVAIFSTVGSDARADVVAGPRHLERPVHLLRLHGDDGDVRAPRRLHPDRARRDGVLLADARRSGGGVQRRPRRGAAGRRDRHLRTDDLLVDLPAPAGADQLRAVCGRRVARARPGVARLAERALAGEGGAVRLRARRGRRRRRDAARATRLPRSTSEGRRAAAGARPPSPARARDTLAPMQPIAPGLWRWTAPHPDWVPGAAAGSAGRLGARRRLRPRRDPGGGGLLRPAPAARSRTRSGPGRTSGSRAGR